MLKGSVENHSKLCLFSCAFPGILLLYAKSFHNIRDWVVVFLVHEISTKYPFVCFVWVTQVRSWLCLNLTILILTWVQDLFSKNQHALDQTNLDSKKTWKKYKPKIKDYFVESFLEILVSNFSCHPVNSLAPTRFQKPWKTLLKIGLWVNQDSCPHVIQSL